MYPSGWTNPRCLDFAAQASGPTWGARDEAQYCLGMLHRCRARSCPRRTKPGTSVRRLWTSRSPAASSRAPPAGSRPTCEHKLGAAARSTTAPGLDLKRLATEGERAVTAARLRPQRAGAATPTRRPSSTRVVAPSPPTLLNPYPPPCQHPLDRSLSAFVFSSVSVSVSVSVYCPSPLFFLPPSFPAAGAEVGVAPYIRMPHFFSFLHTRINPLQARARRTACLARPRCPDHVNSSAACACNRVCPPMPVAAAP